jgi:hypothetical protein
MIEYKVKKTKKLIEVTLPLKEINEACVREKSIRHGHPSASVLSQASSGCCPGSALCLIGERPRLE